MCRFVAYKGHDIFLADLLTRSSQSLIHQSFKSREREEPLNGDGFGVGWYAQEVDPVPCVMTSTQPAWANRNLKRLAPKIRSSCVFAHVRAASAASPVTELNCHPFQFDEFLWMHNGVIPYFSTMKRKLRNSLDDDIYQSIEGTTDSEHAFAVFLQQLKRHRSNYDVNTLAKVMSKTISKLDHWSSTQESPVSHCNFAVTDGHSIVASRYVSDQSEEPQTLYVASGDQFKISDGRYRMTKAGDHPQAVIIASEPLTDVAEDWELVPRNHLVTVSPELHLRVRPL